jgi:hypothetical protein
MGDKYSVDSDGRVDSGYEITRIVVFEMTDDEDNFDPTGFQDCNLINVTSDQNNREVRGIEAPNPVYARLVWFQNSNTSNYSIKFKNDDGDADTGNKIYVRDRADKDLKEQECAGLWYDVTADGGNGGWRTLTRLG